MARICDGWKKNYEFGITSYKLVARRAMKNYSIKNYLASYSMFLLVSPRKI